MIAELDARPEAPTASVFDGIDDPLQRVVEGLQRIEAAEAMDLARTNAMNAARVASS